MQRLETEETPEGLRSIFYAVCDACGKSTSLPLPQVSDTPALWKYIHAALNLVHWRIQHNAKGCRDICRDCSVALKRYFPNPEHE